MDGINGETEQSRDHNFYRYRREPGQAHEEPFSVGEIWPDEDIVPTGDTIQEGGGGEPPYAFKIVNEGDGSVSVTVGTVNTVTATGLTPAGKPTELWLKVTYDAAGEPTAAVVQTTSVSTTATEDSRQIATITWNGDTPSIVQGIKGSQSIASCGATHQWGTLYS